METQIVGGQITAGHLGGYVPGGDPSTFYPALWDWLVHAHGVRTVLDIGCGDGGGSLRCFREAGAKVTGIDGIPQDDPAIITHDYTTGPDPLRRKARFDLGWSCEFVEHVPAANLGNVMGSFKRCDLVLMTHAEPGQGGWHHVNCQPAEYWIGAFLVAGFWLDEILTQETRKLAGMNPDPHNHYVRSGMAFRRADG